MLANHSMELLQDMWLFSCRVIDLTCINVSTITWIPNNNSLKTPNDYMNIYLPSYYLDLLEILFDGMMVISNSEHSSVSPH